MVFIYKCSSHNRFFSLLVDDYILLSSWWHKSYCIRSVPNTFSFRLRMMRVMAVRVEPIDLALMHSYSEKISWILVTASIFIVDFLFLLIWFNVFIRLCSSWRYPNLKSVKDLIYKKGLGKIDKQRTPLTDNNIIEQVILIPHWIHQVV